MHSKVYTLRGIKVVSEVGSLKSDERTKELGPEKNLEKQNVSIK